jgi:hypothetical protein
MVSQITTITRLLLPSQFHPPPDTFRSPPSPSLFLLLPYSSFLFPSPYLFLSFPLFSFSSEILSLIFCSHFSLLPSSFSPCLLTHRETQKLCCIQLENIGFGIDHGGILLKGIGSRDTIKIFCQKWIIKDLQEPRLAF